MKRALVLTGLTLIDSGEGEGRLVPTIATRYRGSFVDRSDTPAGQLPSSPNLQLFEFTAEDDQMTLAQADPDFFIFEPTDV